MARAAGRNGWTWAGSSYEPPQVDPPSPVRERQIIGALPLSIVGALVTSAGGGGVDTLPEAAERWESVVKADGGMPVEYDGGTMYLYGDTIAEDGRFHNSSVVLDDGTVL